MEAGSLKNYFKSFVTILVIWTQTNLGDRAFSAAEPRVWSKLPTDLWQPDLSYSRFRQSMETFVWAAIRPKQVSTSSLTVLYKFYLLTSLLNLLLLYLLSDLPNEDIFSRLYFEAW